jgi:apolipoprotein N-acyltransferase
VAKQGKVPLRLSNLPGTFDILLAAALGALTGALFGADGCGWFVLLLVALLTGRLAYSQPTAAQAAARLAAFAAALGLAALVGAVAALPAPWRQLGLLPVAGWIGLQAGGAALVGLLAFAWRQPAGVRLALVLPALWTALEALLGTGDAALPWLRLGWAQASGPLAGALPYGGALLAGWLTWCVAGLAALAWRQGVPAQGRLHAAGAAAGIVVIAAAAGEVTWTHPAGDLLIALLQPANASSTASDTLGWYAERIAEGGAELVVTPQLALPKTPAALPPGYLDHIDAALRDQRADALIGMHLPDPTGSALHNAVLALGRSSPQLYVKHQLFPFGEYMPLPAAIAARVQAMLPALAETARGPLATAPLHVGGRRVAVAVCWDAAFPALWRDAAATADTLVVVSSDSGLDTPQLGRQTRQLMRALAQVFAKPLVRTSDTRGTLVIDAAGHVTHVLPDHLAGVLHATVETRIGITPYARWGDGIVAACIVASLLLAAATARTPAVIGVPRRRIEAAGQVLPLAGVLLVAVGALFYLMVNSGQAVQEKLRVTQAADAAAYSAGIAQARALNHTAYLNRAIVANQIAIAQMVSYASWLRYFATASDGFGASAADINVFLLPNLQVAQLDAAFGGSAAVAAYLGGRRVADFAEEVTTAIGALITAHDAAAKALSLAQESVHLDLAGGARQEQIALTVAQAMDPALHAEVLPASHDWPSAFHAYARTSRGGDERGRLADVTSRSRDAFTRERNWTLESFDIPLVRKDPALKKRGGTDLIGYDEWRAVDTLELHGRRWGCGKFGLSWCDDVRRPIGWGAVAVRADGTADVRGWHGNAYGDNPTTAELAEAELRAPPTAHYSGLPDTFDVADTDPAHPAAVGITVRITKPLSATHTAGRAAEAQPRGALALFGGDVAVDTLAALARAEVYFDRIAARADGKAELGSLYNPYWRVRLAAPTAADRAEAAARHGGLALP